MLEVLLLEDEGGEGEGADGDEDFVAAIVVGGVVCTVDFYMEKGSVCGMGDR